MNPECANCCNKDRVKELEDYIYEICDIIHMECPLEYQDKWLGAMMDKGLYEWTD
jgi:hypothetical protein